MLSVKASKLNCFSSLSQEVNLLYFAISSFLYFQFKFRLFYRKRVTCNVWCLLRIEPFRIFNVLNTEEMNLYSYIAVERN